MSKGSTRRPTLKKEQAEKNWAEFEKNRKAKQAAKELWAEIHGNLDKIKPVVH